MASRWTLTAASTAATSSAVVTAPTGQVAGAGDPLKKVRVQGVSFFHGGSTLAAAAGTTTIFTATDNEANIFTLGAAGINPVQGYIQDSNGILPFNKSYIFQWTTGSTSFAKGFTAWGDYV